MDFKSQEFDQEHDVLGLVTRPGSDDTGRYTIHEIESTNGVRVNGEDVSVVELAHGDIVDLGHVRMRFVETDASGWPAGPPIPERFVLVDGAPVLVNGETLRIGDLRFQLSEVLRYALRGANIPLHKGVRIQASVALLVAVAAGWDPPEED